MDTYNKYYIIQSRTDLNFLKTFKSLFYKYNEVKFEIDSIDLEFKKDWENKINRYYKSCGCGEGKVFVLLFLLIGIGNLYFQNSFYFSISNLISVFITCLIGAFIGKAYGKFMAFIQLKKVVNQLELIIK